MSDKHPRAALKRRKLTDDQVLEIRTTEGKGTGRRLAERFGLSSAAICRIRKGSLYRQTAAELSGSQDG